MRVGIDYTAAVEEGAGIGRFTRELVGALLATDSENHYVLLAPRGAAPPEWVSACSHARWATLPVSARLAAVLWHRLKVPAPVEWFAGQMDVFHATNYLLPPLKQARGVVTVHDLSFLRHPEWADPRLVSYLSRAVPAAVARADLVTADCEFVKEELRTYLGLPPEKVAVVYGGVSESFRPIEDPEALRQVQARYCLPHQYLLTVTRLEARKNIPGLLRAYRLLLDRSHVEAPLVIGGGPGWGFEKVLQTVEELELSDKVRFLGHIPDPDLQPLLAGAALFVYPSFYEGFGLPPLEAMACGAPVIAGNTSCFPEVLGDAALLVPPDDPDALCKAMELLLESEDLRRDLRCRGMARARQFTWAAAAQQLLSAYRLATQPARTIAGS